MEGADLITEDTQSVADLLPTALGLVGGLGDIGLELLFEELVRDPATEVAATAWKLPFAHTAEVAEAPAEVAEVPAEAAEAQEVAEAPAEAAEEQTAFDVILKAGGDQKIFAIGDAQCLHRSSR